jgi:hypothetical protein
VARQLYIILLALHPARFRYRFAFEMLAIFDEASAHGSRLPLLADGVRSLIRQWVHPYRPVAAAAVSAGDGTPVFHSLDTSLPKRRYLITGATLSLVLFSTLTTSIGRGGRSPGILIGAFHFRPSFLGVDRNSIEPSQPTTAVRVRPAPPEPPRAISLDPQFSFGALDRDGDGMLSAAEMANAPAVLRALDRDKYGNLSPHVPYLVLAILDRDRDGIISSVEISRSTAVLRGLDANRDGTLVRAETYEAERVAAQEYRLRDRESPK